MRIARVGHATNGIIYPYPRWGQAQAKGRESEQEEEDASRPLESERDDETRPRTKKKAERAPAAALALSIDRIGAWASTAVGKNQEQNVCRAELGPWAAIAGGEGKKDRDTDAWLEASLAQAAPQQRAASNGQRMEDG